jgi:hypothetical protein
LTADRPVPEAIFAISATVRNSAWERCRDDGRTPAAGHACLDSPTLAGYRSVRRPAEEHWGSVMIEKPKEPDGERTTEEGHNAHPVEPAEGAREPGEDADEPRPPHPDQPAEGER